MPIPYSSPAATERALTESLNPTTIKQIDAIKAASALVPIPNQNPVVPGEPAVLSSRAGADAFKSMVQPDINTANAAVTAAAEKRNADAQAKAAAAVSKGEAIPQDVLDELNAGKTPEEQAAAAKLTAWNKQIADATSVADSLTLAAKATAAAEINTLKGQWEERKQLLEKSNSAELATWDQQFLRTGQAEYSPGMTGTFITSKEQAGQAKVKALDDEYNAKIAVINKELDKGNYERAATLTKDLNAIEDKALTLMSENAKTAAAINKKMKDDLAKSSREMAISGLVAQGITDPTEIQDYLNNTDTGEQVGITLEEISKTLKIVNPNTDLAGTSADYKTFKYLQDKKDPAVEGLDYMGFLKAVGIAQRKADTGTSTEFKFSQAQQSQLLTGGFNTTDIANMQSDIAAHGLDTTISGMSKEQQDLIKRTLAGSDTVAGITSPADKFITTDYLSSLFGDAALQKSANDAGFRHMLTSWDTEKQNYLDSLMNTVAQYRTAGYTDQEILKMMQ